MIAPALETVDRLVEDGLLVFDGVHARLAARGQLIANEVFEQFLQPALAQAGAQNQSR
jgi:hypothetical protein